MIGELGVKEDFGELNFGERKSFSLLNQRQDVCAFPHRENAGGLHRNRFRGKAVLGNRLQQCERLWKLPTPGVEVGNLHF